jgi:hypothetical protein
MYQALADPSPEMALLRRGLFRYWRQSPEGRSASMGLLSTQDSRMGAMAWEYARVMGYSLPKLLEREAAGTPWTHRSRAALGLVRSALPWVSMTVRGALEDVPLPRRLSRP